MPRKDTKLTPRLIMLLQMLMEKHGEVIERDVLFKKVWETNYTGDKRRWMFMFLGSGRD